jgi:hypothetical protein
VARGELLGRRTLNRALLERQLLLHRRAMPAVAAIEHLVGVQAQAPLAPYVGLWTRLADFATGELAGLLRERRAVRTHAMRATIHLLSARDCQALRPVMQPVIARSYAGSPFARNLAGVDVDALLAAGRELLDERPLTRAELGRRLRERWPDREPESLGTAVCLLVPTVQATPRGLWGATGPAAWATVESWLGEPLPAPRAPDAAVLRYLAAFGPATVADIRTWSGLSGLREVIARLRPRLHAFRDEDGRELLDLPAGPRPDPETPAPPRLLPDYDNVLLSHADRRRINDLGRPVPLPPGSGARTGNVLVDGFFRGRWRLDGARVRIEPFARLSRADSSALAAEADALLRLVTSPA